MADPIYRQFITLVLFQAQVDRATELLITPAAEAPSAIKYKVDGKWHDLAPPPPHLIPSVLSTLATMAGLGDGEFPREGVIDLRFASARLHWKIRMTNAAWECILTPIEE